MIERSKIIEKDDSEYGKEYVLLSDARTYGDQRAAEARADALQAMERVPMTEEVALKFAHRRATTYTHRSDPHYSGYAFVPYTLMDFVRDLEAHHNITPPESNG